MALMMVSTVVGCGDEDSPPEIAAMRDTLVGLNAQLLDSMAQAETTLVPSVATLHASILAAQLETPDTMEAYLEVKDQLGELRALREQSAGELDLPSGYTPPTVPEVALGGTAVDPETALTTTLHDGFQMDDLFRSIQSATLDVERKLEELRKKGDQISIVDMFEMQMMMNKLSQLSEMSTSVMSATNSAISSMARNVKS
jgi:hypothetical protein